MTRKTIDAVGAYTEYATKNENSYLYNRLWKKRKKKGKGNNYLFPLPGFATHTFLAESNVEPEGQGSCISCSTLGMT